MINDIRICFVGDSLVNGTGDQHALGWAGRLCASGKDGIAITYYNIGIRRDTSSDILERIEEVSRRLPTSVDSRVVISFGVNDTAIEDGKVRVSECDSISNFEAIIKHLKPAYKVLMVGPPPINDCEHNSRIKSLNQALQIKAHALETPFIDLFSKMIGDEEYKQEITDNDGAHPRSDGYEKLANIISSSEYWWF